MRGSPAQFRVRGRRAARGALLLEIMLAVGIFVMAGVAILSQVSGSLGAMTRTRDDVRAADLARSAMARLEAGIESLRSVSGPVRLWAEDEEAQDEAGSGPSDFGAGFADSLPRDSVWEVEAQTEPSPFDGLTNVAITARKRAAPGSETIVAAYTLRQLVRLSARAEDAAGDVGELGGAVDRERPPAGARATPPRRPVPSRGPQP